MAKRKKRIVKPRYVTREERKKQSKKPMSKEFKVGLIVCGAALALAIVLFMVFYHGDSLPVKNGEVVVEGDNWIVANLASGNAKRYYKLGEVNAAEGFVADPEQTVKSDTNEKDYWFVPDDESSQITHYYVCGVNQPPAKMVADVRASFVGMYGEETVSDISTATVGGHEASYFSAITVDTTTDPTAEKTTQMLCLYLPAIRDASILVSVMLDVTEDMPALADAELLDLAERIVSGISIEQK